MQTMAAVVYDAGSGGQVDEILSSLARAYARDGLKLAGIVQRSIERPDRCACDMIATDLASGSDVALSEDRGAMATGCRLDTAQLERLAGDAHAALEHGAEILIVNKFGKQEAAGAGFRSVIADAAGRGVPVLVGVNRAYIEDWRAFAGTMAVEVAANPDAVHQWLAATLTEARACTAPA